MRLKIHIVQKGETIWDIAQKYDVDFEKVKEVNPQISSPDMIMPGMKIKIPSSTKQVKHKEKQTKPVKEKQKETQKKDMAEPQKIEKIEPDDTKQLEKIEVKPPTGQQPILPMEQSPIIKEQVKKQEQKKEQPTTEAHESKKEKPLLQTKKQPQMPSFNDIPKLEPKEPDLKKPVHKTENQPVKCCCCCQSWHPCHGPNHVSNGYPPAQPMPYMSPCQMIQPRQNLVAHPGYMNPYQPNLEPNHYVQPVTQPIQSMPQPPQHMQTRQMDYPPVFGRPYEHPTTAQHSYSSVGPIKGEDSTENVHPTSFGNEASGHPIRSNPNSFPQPPLYPAHPRTHTNEQ